MMNKAQARQLAMIEVYLSNDMRDTAARSLSALIRSALVRKTAQELYRFAVTHGLNTHPDFIV
jgi:hypothetical protein